MIACLCLLVALLSRNIAKAPDRVPGRQIAGYLLAMLIIGPGNAVNMGFKDNWGRARPIHISKFGGERQFSPAQVPGDQCKRDCFFISSDSSPGFTLVALGLASPHRRRFGIVPGFLAGTGSGTARVSIGAHFVNDIVFAGVLMPPGAALLYLSMTQTRVVRGR